MSRGLAISRRLRDEFDLSGRETANGTGGRGQGRFTGRYDGGWADAVGAEEVGRGGTGGQHGDGGRRGGGEAGGVLSVSFG